MYDITFSSFEVSKLIMPTCETLVFSYVLRADNRFCPRFLLSHISPTYNNSPCLPLRLPSHASCLWQLSAVVAVCIYLSRYKQTFHCSCSWIQFKGSLPMRFCFVINIWLLYRVLSGWGEMEGGWKMQKTKKKPHKEKPPVRWSFLDLASQSAGQTVLFFSEARVDEVKGALLTPVQSQRFTGKKRAPFWSSTPADVTLKEMLWRGWGQRGIQASQWSVVSQQHHKDMTLSL